MIMDNLGELEDLNVKITASPTNPLHILLCLHFGCPNQMLK